MKIKLIRHSWIFIVVSLIGIVISVQASTTKAAETVVDLVRSDNEGIEISVKFPMYEIRTNMKEGGEFQNLSVPGTDTCIQPGQPEVPVKNLIVAIPPDVNYELEVIHKEMIVLDGMYRLPISPSPKPISSDVEPGLLSSADTFLPDEQSQSGECLPLNVVKIASEAWVRDQRILNLQVFPFRYSQVSGILEWNPDIQFKIQFTWDDAKDHPELIQIDEPGNPFEKVLENMLLNYDQARNWRGYSMDQVHPYQKMPVPSAENLGDSDLYKITITEDGFYKLSYEVLDQVGLPVDTLDPTTLRITNQGDEVAIYVHNIENLNEFSPGEYLIFYGQHFSGEKIAALYLQEDDLWISYPYNDGTGRVWEPQFNAEMVEKYTDENVYWLSFGGTSGKRMVLRGEASGGTAAETTTALSHAEESNIWRTYLFAGEDTWYWERIQVVEPATSTFSISIPHPAGLGSSATLRGELVFENYDATRNPDHRVTGYINDDQYISPIFVAEWDGKGRFQFEATFSDDILIDGINQLDLDFDNLYNNTEAIYFDWFEIEYDQQLVAVDNQMWLNGGAEGETQVFTIDGLESLNTDDIHVFDVTDPINPIRHYGGTLNGGRFSYTFTHPPNARYYVGKVVSISSDNILNFAPEILDTPADYVIITHKDFLSESQRLADYRASQGMSTLVVDIEQLINQYNYGIYHPIAIKNFIAYTFDPQNWSFAPTYVLLVGDGHWNFHKNPTYDSPPIYMPPNLSWVDPWQGEVDSSNLLGNVVNPESSPDPVADVLISRIPVNSNQEMASVVDKIISFEASDKGEWERNLFFLTDNPDGAGNFSLSADQMINEFSSQGIIPFRMYLEYFQQKGICTPDSSSACPELRDYFIDHLETDGALFVNYYGHGWIYRWASESLLTNSDIPSMNNTRLPIIFSSTCLDGYWIHPNEIINSYSGSSIIEDLIRSENYGAVGAFSPTGLGLSTGHDVLQRGFYESLYNDGAQYLGEMSLQAKLRLYQTQVYQDLLHTFTVFGDPALRLPQVGDIETPYRINLPLLTK